MGVKKLIALVDVGSTYTKAAVVDRAGKLVARGKVATQLQDLAVGMQDALDSAAEGARSGRVDEVLACSSAGGGLRVAVIGLERRLTVESARRAAATAGARIVSAHAGVLGHEALAEISSVAPDVVLLTGGTNGGDRRTISANASGLREFLPDVPVVVAGNEGAYRAVREALGSDQPVSFARNVLPEIGRLDVEDAQQRIRDIFIEHVIGCGRLVSSSPLGRSIRMPTPRAVLEATRVLAVLGRRIDRAQRPVVLDVGGATTDVHSCLPVDESNRGLGSHAVPDQPLTRTVEGDLGVRENAESLLDEALRTGLVETDEADRLRPAVTLRRQHRKHLPAGRGDATVDDRLAALASALALERHAGKIHVTLSPDGAVLRKTGRDLREMSCLVATGGIFEHSPDPGTIVASAIDLARKHGTLIPQEPEVVVDRSYVLSAAGLLSISRPELARRLLLNELIVDEGIDVWLN